LDEDAASCVVYADESGHSGDNYLDPQQPIFVMAAWVVPSASVSKVSQAVADTRVRHAPSGSRRPELKFSRLVRNAAGQTLVADLLSGLMTFGAVPVVEVWEKSFGISTRVVDALCDEDHNDAARVRLPSFMGDRRKKFAYWLDENLPTDALREFAVAFRQGNEGKLERARDRISNLLTLAGRDEDGWMIAQCDITAMVKVEHDESLRAHRTIHLPAFLGLLGNCQRVLERCDETAELRYDEQSEFRQPFEDAYSMMEDVPLREIPISETRMAGFGASRIESLSMESSTFSPGIQAADALANTVRVGVADPSKFAGASPLAEPLRTIFGVPVAGGSPLSLGDTASLNISQPRFKQILQEMHSPLANV